MFSKKKFLLTVKINILIVLLLVFVKLMPVTLSKYETVANSKVDSNIAFYLLDTNYYTESIKLSSLSPSDNPYIYTFTVSNFNDTKESEVDIEYDLSLIMTTNLPLRYKLYKNEDYTNSSSNNLITDTNSRIELDSDGTYFKIVNFDTENLFYNSHTTNTYTLLVYYDKSNSNPIYQDTIESVKIVVKSRQIID